MNKANHRLIIAMVGLPARGKSTISNKIMHYLNRYRIKTKVFNNGALRRKYGPPESALAEFYNPDNLKASSFREKIAIMNFERALRYVENSGNVAILDATNVSLKRRRLILEFFKDYPLLFIECQNDNKDIIEMNIQKKVQTSEFKNLKTEEAIETFKKRIEYYKLIYTPLKEERNYLILDSLNSKIIEEYISDSLPYYELLRDLLVTDIVRSLFLIRHGETYFNLENRIGGDSPLTERGKEQAHMLGRHFSNKRIPKIFTSTKRRSIETAEIIGSYQKNPEIIQLKEFDEINSGICEGMSYEEIERYMPEVYYNRKKDKFNYVYPGGEGYVTMKERINLGIKKALFLSNVGENVMIIGHRAVNRMILSHFLYKREEDVPYIYIPQDQYYHIVSMERKKLFQLKPYK